MPRTNNKPKKIYNTPPTLVRLEKKIIRGATEDDCCEWTGAKSKTGIPVTKQDGKVVGVKGVLWKETYGTKNKFRYVYSICNNNGCVNVKHLRVSMSRGGGALIISKNKRSFRSRVSLDVPTPIHNGLMSLIKQKNMTITRFICLLILREMKKYNMT